MQGGIGKGLAMEWAYGEKEFVNETEIDSLPADSGRTLPLNRAEIFVPNDTSALETPSGFERPQPQGYRIIATRSSGAPSCPVVGSVTLSDANPASSRSFRRQPPRRPSFRTMWHAPPFGSRSSASATTSLRSSRHFGSTSPTGRTQPSTRPPPFGPACPPHCPFSSRSTGPSRVRPAPL